MNYKYIYPLFENGEEEQAREFLMDDMIEHIPMKFVRTDSDDEEDDEYEYEDEIPLTELPKNIVKNIVGRLVDNMYGINSVLMANYAIVEDVFFKKIGQHLLKYFCYSYNAQLVTLEPGQIASKVLTHKALFDKKFKPISIWNPNEKWINMDYNFVLNKNINLLKPLNCRSYCALVIKDIELQSEFIQKMKAYSIPFCVDNDNSIFIELLPAKNYYNILKVVQFAHEFI